MTLNSISLMDAYLIETLRYNGVSNEELIKRVRFGDVRSWKKLSSNLDFEQLPLLYDQDSSKFQSVISNGYTIKFVTMNGLINLLQLKFNKIKDIDFKRSINGIVDLTIDDSQLSELKNILSNNWMIQSDIYSQSNHNIVSIRTLKKSPVT